MSDKKPTPAKAANAATVKTVKKSAPPKKVASKKTAASKQAAPKKVVLKKAAQKKSAEKTTTPKTLAQPDMQSVLQEMHSQRKSRDQHLSSLIEELREGFDTQSSRSSKQSEAHQKEMTGLYQTLQTTFGKIKDDSNASEVLNLDVFKSLSNSIKNDHEQTLKEINAQGKLQDKKIEHMSKMLEQRTVRNRWIAIPGVIIAVIAVVYMFYVVSVMETAMTNMSSNMQLMQKDVSHMASSMVDMSGHIASISQDTGSMSGDMGQLNNNVGNMSKDLNAMTRSVAPAMRGMHDMMPWGP